ncbi:cardiolipin synthase [Aquimonas voraii]|uniref:Cardiolipin synthase n=1 Tax=Aquimonas voraii TaxID=265719 RepID=A0A1G6ZYR5_9GAMM|nr:cardiolipin synthase [Aquimonas voraii]SDE07641.1 cardiolipin synthetase 2 [Aquimonas voraii]
MDSQAAYWLGLGWALYLGALSVWIVLQKRPPVSTLAWILSLAALPVVGFAIYHWLGPVRIRRQQLKRRRSRRRLEREPLSECDVLAALASPLEQRQARLVERLTRIAPTTAQRIELLSDGAATYSALLAAIHGAREHVHCEYYIFEPDRIGCAVRDALAERARAGVAVRLLVDAVGSAGLSKRFLRPLRDAGAEVVFFHPFRLATLRPLLNLRTHRKIAVIDGRIGFTGGINVSDTQDERVHSGAFRDLHLRIEGAAVNGLQQVFVEDWLYASRRPLKQHGMFPLLPPGEIPLQWLPSGPDTPQEPIHRAMLQGIGDAERRVWLVTPYFVPPEPALYALSRAAQRGVDVRVLVPRRADSRTVTYASRSYFDELLRAGVRVFEYTPRMLHTKALLVDEALCTLGSANFDARSFRLNFELCLNLYGAGPARALEAVLQLDFANAIEVRRPRRLTRAQRLAEAGARLLSPVL